jgi:hypothetical protein
MAHQKKTFDGKKRRVKKPPRKQRQKKGARTFVGRPGTNKQDLFDHREAALELLSTNWARIGWRLSRAESPGELRKALWPLRGASPLDHWIGHFLREQTEESKPQQIRLTLKLMAREAEKNLGIQGKYDLLTRKYDEADAANSQRDETVDQTISNEFKRRGDEMEECERELFASNVSLMTWNKS